MRKWSSILTFSILILAGKAMPLFSAENGASGPVPYQKNAVITGQVMAEKHCAQTSDHRPPEVWLSMGQILLYQVEVPVSGNYEFHVVPGKYDLLATNSSGCLSQTEVKVGSKQVAQVNLRLASGRAPAAAGK